MAAIYGKGQKITKDFFDTAEEEVLKALKGFAENAEGEDAFQKLLFAEDTAEVLLLLSCVESAMM